MCQHVLTVSDTDISRNCARVSKFVTVGETVVGK
jgi:hypothetical protein